MEVALICMAACMGQSVGTGRLAVPSTLLPSLGSTALTCPALVGAATRRQLQPWGLRCMLTLYAQ